MSRNAGVLAVTVMVLLGALPCRAEPALAKHGYLLELRGAPERLGRYEVDGRQASEAECRAAGDRCRELVQVGWTIRKEKGDTLDGSFPLLCVIAVVNQGFTRRSGRETCARLALGESEEHTLLVAGPPGCGKGHLEVVLEMERRTQRGGAAQLLGRLQGSWEVPGRFAGWRRFAVRGPLIWGLAAAVVVGLVLFGCLAWRKRARQRQDGDLTNGSRPLAAPAPEPRELGAASPAAMPLAAGTPVVAAAIQLRVDPVELPPDGRSLARATARVTGPDGSPLAGVEVSFVAELGRSGGRLTHSVGVTDGEGCAVLEVAPPLLSEQRRLYVTAAVVAAEGGASSERVWIRIRDVAVQVRPDRARLTVPSDERHLMAAFLCDDAGQGVSGVELRASVIDAAGGSIQPDTALTDEKGRAAFFYTPGARSGEVRVRVWPEGEPRRAAEIMVEQVE